MGRIIVFMAASLSAAMLFSCDDNRRGGPDAQGDAIRVPNVVEESVTVNMNFEGPWTLDNRTSWLVVSPKSGDAGDVAITLTPIETNPDLGERTGTFTVDCGGSLVEYYVFQDGISGVVVPDAVTASFEGTCCISLKGNVEYSVSSDDGWITVGGVTDGEPELLDDGVTESHLRTSSVELSLASNEGDELREGTVTVSFNGEEHPVRVLQIPAAEADAGRDFIRRSLLIKLTGTWCANCPIMSEGIHSAMEEYPDHIVTMSMYDGGSGGLSYSDESYYAEMYSIYGYPAGIFNSYAYVNNGASVQTKDGIVSLAGEAVSDLPSNTVISGVAAVASDSIDLTVGISVKSAGDYNVSVWLLEDGIIAPQSGASSDYVHDHVIRSTATGPVGDTYPLESGVTALSFRLPIPGTVVNKENLRVVAITSYVGTFTGGTVGVIEYRDYGYVVDNVSEIPVDGTYQEYKYE